MKPPTDHQLTPIVAGTNHMHSDIGMRAGLLKGPDDIAALTERLLATGDLHEVVPALIEAIGKMDRRSGAD